MFNPQERATCWSLTINNPVEADEENIAMARQKGWKVDGQKEVGTEGTPHYQLILRTPQIRGSAIKKQFPRAHIEICRDPIALQKYVHKEETKVGELAEQSEQYPSLQKFWGHLYDYMVTNNWYYSEGRWIRTYLGDQRDDVLHGDVKLVWFDKFGGDMIRRGYVVETMLVNPQIRSIFKQFGKEILVREEVRKRQKDRQTDEDLVSTHSITDAQEDGEVQEGSQSEGVP